MVRSGGHRHQLLPDGLEIGSLRQHATGDRHRWIATLDGKGRRDRRIGINPKRHYLSGDHRSGVQQRCPNQPRQGEHYADAYQTHQQGTAYPRLGIAAAEPLGSIGHPANLVWLSCLAAEGRTLFSTAGRRIAMLPAARAASCNHLGRREGAAMATRAVAA
jgi:hypothetical protein